MGKCLLLAALLVFSSGCSGLMDGFLDEQRDDGTTDPPSTVKPDADLDLSITPGRVEASGGGTHSIRARVRYKDRNEISGGGTHSMRVELGKRSK